MFNVLAQGGRLNVHAPRRSGRLVVAATPFPTSATSHGLARAVSSGPSRAPSTRSSRSALSRRRLLRRHVHSFEEALYVLEGELLIEIGGTRPPPAAGRLRADPDRRAARARRTAGDEPVRWLSVNTPQRLAPDAGRKDTFFEPTPPDVAGLVARGRAPGVRRPDACAASATTTARRPQPRRFASTMPARGREAAGMDTALLVYSGISVKMLIDRVFGADLLTMFTVDYELGGSAQAARPPVRGDVLLPRPARSRPSSTARSTRSGPGDVVFAGVGAVHGFYNTGSERVRWIETQAPQPPARHAYRWVADLEASSRRTHAWQE